MAGDTQSASLRVPATVPRGRIALAGVAAGFTSGLFGVGGGIIIVPMLVYGAGFPHKLATGTSLSAILPISMAGVVGYAIGGQVDLPVALIIAAGSLLGTLAGTYLLVRVSVLSLQLVFGMAMTVTAVRMLVEQGDGAGRPQLSVGAAAALLALGFAAGVLAGLLGVGGGIIIVPALTILFGMPLVLAKGTSLLMIVPTAIIGTIRNRQAGLTAMLPAAMVGGTGIVTAVVASHVSVGLEPRVSSALFAVLLVLVSVRLGRSALAERTGTTTD